MKNYVLPTMANLCDERVRDELVDVGSLATSADCWLDAGRRAYLGVTGHFISTDWQRRYDQKSQLYFITLCRNCALDLFHVTEKKTAEELHAMTQEVVDRFADDRVYLSAIIIDGESAMQKGILEYVSEENSLWCLTHQLALITNAVTEVSCT